MPADLSPSLVRQLLPAKSNVIPDRQETIKTWIPQIPLPKEEEFRNPAGDSAL
jgi:hypothetical protein